MASTSPPHTNPTSPAPSSTGKVSSTGRTRYPRITRKQFNPPLGWAETSGYTVNTVHTAKCDDCNKHGTDVNPIKKCNDCMHKVCWDCEQSKDNGLNHGCLMGNSATALGPLRPPPESKTTAPAQSLLREGTDSSNARPSSTENISPETHPHLYASLDYRNDPGHGKRQSLRNLAKRNTPGIAEGTPAKKPRLAPKVNTLAPESLRYQDPTPTSRGSTPFAAGAFDRPSFDAANRRRLQTDFRKPLLPSLDPQTLRTRDEFWNIFSNATQDEIKEIKHQAMWFFELEPREGGPNEASHNPGAEGRVKRAYYSQIFKNAGFAMTSTGQEEFQALQGVQNQVDQRLQALHDSYMLAESKSPSMASDHDTSYRPSGKTTPASSASVEPSARSSLHEGHSRRAYSLTPFLSARSEDSPVQGKLGPIAKRYAANVISDNPSTPAENHATNPYGLGSSVAKYNARSQAHSTPTSVPLSSDNAADRCRSMTIQNMLNSNEKGGRGRDRPTEMSYGAGCTY